MKLCVFSKHFQALNFRELGRTMRELGINGVDLTVREGGHIEPAEVKEKLPEAREILKENGVEITMITTNITSIDNPYAIETLETAAKLGIKYFKFGYFFYRGFGNLKRDIQEAKAKLKSLEHLCLELGIKGGYHNHSGDFLGASVPHILKMIEDCNPECIGVYYDIGHATIEGGYSGWKMNLEEVRDRLFMVAAKDLAFTAKDGGDWRWRVEVVPIGEGLVNWREFIRYLKSIGFSGPFSLHSEYDLPVEEVIEQTRKDLAYLRNCGI
ncbi:MAG: sugar phosphate isomerase/epimerase family protein [bacterium]